MEIGCARIGNVQVVFFVVGLTHSSFVCVFVVVVILLPYEYFCVRQGGFGWHRKAILAIWWFRRQGFRLPQ